MIREPEVWRFLPETYPAHIDEALARDLILISSELGHHYVLAIVVGGRPVGQVRLLFDANDPSRSRGEISYWLGREHWGKRLGSEVVFDFTHRSFDEFPSLMTIVARVHRDNRASARVLFKAGYRLSPAVDPASPWLAFMLQRPDNRSDQLTAA